MLELNPCLARRRSRASVTRPVERRVRGACAATVASGASLLWADRVVSDPGVVFVKERFISSLQFEKGTLSSVPC
jgi:hypothetical protein